MITDSCSRPFRKLKCAITWVLLTLTLSHAEEPWRLLVEPSFLRNEAAWPITGSDRTVLVPARFVNGEIKPLTREEAAAGVNRQTILAQAPRAAAEVLKTLKPEYVRDANKVIEYAVLRSDSPLTASAVLAPDFAKLFADTLGPDVLIAIPNRYHIFIFPRLSTAFEGMTDIIVAEYESSGEPVSRELFTLRNGNLSALGLYR